MGRLDKPTLQETVSWGWGDNAWHTRHRLPSLMCCEGTRSEPYNLLNNPLREGTG